MFDKYIWMREEGIEKCYDDIEEIVDDIQAVAEKVADMNKLNYDNLHDIVDRVFEEVTDSLHYRRKGGWVK